MNVDKVIENIEKSMDGLGVRKFLGTNIEDADPRLLDPREGDINEHVALQPSITSFFGMIYKTMLNRLSEKTREYELWRSAKYLNVKSELGPKTPIKDVEALLDTKYSTEVLAFEKEIRNLQQQTDDIGVYVDAIKSKSFTLQLFCKTDHEEFMSTDHYSGNNNSNNKPQQSFDQSTNNMRKMMNNGNNLNKEGGTSSYKNA